MHACLVASVGNYLLASPPSLQLQTLARVLLPTSSAPPTLRSFLDVQAASGPQFSTALRASARTRMTQAKGRQPLEHTKVHDCWDYAPAAPAMLRNKAFTVLQKTYDDSYLSCSTAVYYEGQVCLPGECVFAWGSILLMTRHVLSRETSSRPCAIGGMLSTTSTSITPRR